MQQGKFMEGKSIESYWIEKVSFLSKLQITAEQIHLVEYHYMLDLFGFFFLGIYFRFHSEAR